MSEEKLGGNKILIVFGIGIWNIFASDLENYKAWDI